QHLQNYEYKGMIRVLSEMTTNPSHEFVCKNTNTKIKKSKPQVVRT
ncbi:MAG: hypothetical protein ACI89Z_001542, partial [Porticoccus sp.]